MTIYGDDGTRTIDRCNAKGRQQKGCHENEGATPHYLAHQPPFYIRALRSTYAHLRYRSFSVLRLRSASTMEMIQNRTMTLGSIHPFSSK